jgi:hypothetical protein
MVLMAWSTLRAWAAVGLYKVFGGPMANCICLPLANQDKAVLKRFGELQSAMPASGAKHVQSLSRTQHFCTRYII